MTREEALQAIKAKMDYYESDKRLRAALETLIPELAESEDERIRKRIHLCLDECVHSDIIRDYERDECLAYLEKQEEYPTNEEMLRTLRAEYEKGVADTIAKYEQKEQKSLNISAASEWLREHVCHYMNSEYNEFHKCVEYDGSIDKERLINDFEEAMRKEQDECPEYCVRSHCMGCSIYEKQKEKPSIFPPGFGEVRWNPISSVQQKPADWDELQVDFRNINEAFEDGKKEVIANPEKYGLCDCKPAEWSDDKFPKDIEADAVQFCFDNGINITPYQAKQIATHYLMVGHNEGYVEGRKNAHIPAKELGLPSSLDFKQELSEKEIEHLYTLASHIKSSGYEDDGEFLEGVADKLKSLRSSWKPSEEEMKALKECGECKRCIKKLYEDLQKRYGTC